MIKNIFLLLSILFIVTFDLFCTTSVNERVKNFIYSNVSDAKMNNIIVIPISINACYSCNSPKINLLFRYLKKNIKYSKTMLIVESAIPKDAFSLKKRYECDYFIEDTSMLFSSNKLQYPNIIIFDRNKNSYVFDFYRILHFLNGLNKLINSEVYHPLKEIPIDEGKKYIFSETFKPLILKRKLFFLAKRRNQILSYDLIKKKINNYFKPDTDNLLILSKVNKDKIDTMKKYDLFILDFLFNLLAIDIDYSTNTLYILCDVLSELEMRKNNILIHKKRGILSVDKEKNMEYNPFKIKNFVEYSDINCSNDTKIITIVNQELNNNDNFASILKVKNDIKFDTIAYYKEFWVKDSTSILRYLPKLVRIDNNSKIYVISQKLNRNYRIFIGDSIVKSSFLLSGVFNYFDNFDVNDMIIMDKTIYVIALLDNSKFLIQSYQFDGNLLSEKLYYTPQDIISTLFIKNLNNKIILLNKWRYKRWTIDYFDKTGRSQ